jgi:hypothetical protein
MLLRPKPSPSEQKEVVTPGPIGRFIERVKGMVASILLEEDHSTWQNAEHDRESLRKVREVVNSVMQPIIAVRDAFSRTFIEPFESPEAPKGERTSFVRKRFLAIFAATSMGIAQILDAVNPPEDPLPFGYASSTFGLPRDGEPPPLDTPPHSLYVTLQHPDDFCEFLQEHTQYEYPKGLIDFFARYRSAPETYFQDTITVKDGNGKNTKKAVGACNRRVEFIARELWAHGVQPSIGRTRPPVAELIFGWQWKQCHEIVMYRIEGDEYVIFSNDDYVFVKAKSPEDAIRKFDPKGIVLEVGGVAPWKETKNNVIARFAHSMDCNQTELPEHPRHRFVPRRTFDAATIVANGFNDPRMTAATIFARIKGKFSK